MFLKQRIRRLAAGGGILALALAGVLGSTSAASAEGYPAVPDQNGTLTIHKHVKDGQSTPGHPAGAPLAGVGFSVQKLGVMSGGNCVAVNLTTPAGWQSVSAAMAAFNAATGAIPAGFCAAGASFDDTTSPAGLISLDPAKGLYLVNETTPGDNLIVEKAEPFLVTVPMPVAGTGGAAGSWDFSVDAYPKNTLGTFVPTKTAGTTNVGGAVVPGAVVPWTISTPVPQSPFPYKTIVITDTPAAGHTFTAWGEVRLNGTLLVGTGATPDYSTSGGTLTLLAPGLAKVNAITGGAAATITVTLTTTVNTTVPGGFANNADVTLNSTTKPVTPPQTNWGKLVIKKHKAGNTQATLEGARFAIYPKTADCATDVQGTPVWTTPATPNPSAAQQEAILWISNTAGGAAVGAKVYCLQETQAPTGYVLDSTPREVTISDAGEWVTQYNFPNVEVPEPPLPLTGSTGTMAFGLIGFGLIGAAATLFAVRRSRAAKR